MRLLKRMLVFFLCVAMVFGQVAIGAEAAKWDGAKDDTISYINPLYADVISEEDLFYAPPVMYAAESSKYCTTIEEAGAELRKQMKNWESSCVVYLRTDTYNSNWHKDIFNAAVKHTGDPTEGDYLRWSYAGYRVSVMGGDGYIGFTYAMTYYTTPEQEAVLDQAVTKLLNDLDLYDASEYEMICGIYDYMCANIVYDYDNLEDDTYKLKYSAYAALINKTAVCQGYALLFYRLALNLGLDCRLISGIGNGGGHAWNLVRIGDQYYWLDATWDATWLQAVGFYRYFLRCESNFGDHHPEEDWEALGYNISKTDYVPNTECDHKMGAWLLLEDATCTQNGSKIRYCEYADCDYSEIRIIGAYGHSYSSVYTAPTCAKEGYNTYTCACGYSYKDYIEEALGHNWSNWVTVNAPTCVKKGTSRRDCNRCDSYETKELSAKGHSYTASVTSPTCTEKGYTTYTCACGDTYVGRETPAAGHFWNFCVTNRAPTETVPGLRTYTCGRCGATKTEEIPCIGDNQKESAVQRIYGQNRVETALAVAAALKETLGVDRFDAVIIATGVNEKFADALAGSYLANMKKAPILLYTNAGLSKQTVAFIEQNLSANGTVYILGGTSAVPASVERTLSGYKIVRLAGNTRYETNLAILDEAGVSSANEILIATGTNFADSLSASATGLPIMLVNGKGNSLSAVQVQFLKSVAGKKITIIGGTAAVSAKLEEVIEGITGVNADRISGNTRHNTSVMIAQKYFTAPDYALITYAKNFPDGLAGGPLAYALGAPLLLTDKGNESIANAYIKAENIQKGYVLGGEAVVSVGTVQKVYGLPADAVISKK